jgi:hypothetical protein
MLLRVPTTHSLMLAGSLCNAIAVALGLLGYISGANVSKHTAESGLEDCASQLSCSVCQWTHACNQCNIHTVGHMAYLGLSVC